MDIKVKWFYRLAFLLLLFIVLFIFFKLKPYWYPLIKMTISVTYPFIIAFFITYLLYPFIEYLHKNGLPKALSVTLIYLLFFGGIGTMIYKGLPVFIEQLKDLSENAPNVLKQYENWVAMVEHNTKKWPNGLQEQIKEGFIAINKGIENYAEKVLNLFFWLVDQFVVLSLIPFIAFYMIKDMEYLQKVFWSLIPKKWRHPLQVLIADVDQSLGSYIRGQILVCLLVGLASSLLFWLIKLKYPLLLGFIIGVTNVIPYFGPIIGIIPAIIIAATISIKMVIYVILINFVLQFLEGNIFSPYIVGKSVSMHPLLIMISILIGGEIGGIIGLVLAVPVVVVIKTAILQARNHWQRKEA